MSNESRIQPGIYKGRAVAGSEQFGKSKSGNDQVAIDLNIPDLGRKLTTFLSFAEKAHPYSLERLQALGWQPGSEEGLPGIDRNEVEVSVSYRTDDKGIERLDVQIQTQGGRAKMKEEMAVPEKKVFLKNLNKAASNGTQSAGYPSNWDQTQGQPKAAGGVKF